MGSLREEAGRFCWPNSTGNIDLPPAIPFLTEDQKSRGEKHFFFIISYVPPSHSFLLHHPHAHSTTCPTFRYVAVGGLPSSLPYKSPKYQSSRFASPSQKCCCELRRGNSHPEGIAVQESHHKGLSPRPGHAIGDVRDVVAPNSRSCLTHSPKSHPVSPPGSAYRSPIPAREGFDTTYMGASSFKTQAAFYRVFTTLSCFLPRFANVDSERVLPPVTSTHR